MEFKLERLRLLCVEALLFVPSLSDCKESILYHLKSQHNEDKTACDRHVESFAACRIHPGFCASVVMMASDCMILDMLDQISKSPRRFG